MAKTTATNSLKSTKSLKSAPGVNNDLILVNMESVVDDGSSGLDDLLADLIAGNPLDMASIGGEEVVDSSEVDVPIVDAPALEATAAEIESAVGQVESVELMIAAATLDDMVDPGAVPTSAGFVESEEGEEGEEGEAPAAVGAEPKAPKAKVPKKFYADKVDRIIDRLGSEAVSFTVLTLADAGVDDEQLRFRMEETFAIIKGLNVKEKNRAGFLMDFLSGKTAKLSNVLETTLRVLHRDGEITTGKVGNLLNELLAKPYSIASARAMSSNTLGMYAALKLLKEDGKGRFLANPDSTLLAAANAKLGFVAA